MTHTHYKGTGKIHSFRGLLENDGQDKIRIQGSAGAIAWRIVKFQVMGPNANQNIESVVKVLRESAAVSTDINFNDTDLLAAAVINESAGTAYLPAVVVIFDNILFSRNIFVTNKGHDEISDLNYYIELEEVKVSKAVW